MEGIGTIPKRTGLQVKCQVPLRALSSDTEVTVTVKPEDLHYECLDCDYETDDIAMMNDHQDNQKDRHTYWEQLNRWMAMNTLRNSL